MLEFQILGCGTSTGVPVPGCKCRVCQSGKPKNNRLRTSAVLKKKGEGSILIDAGPDLRLQALRYGLDDVIYVLYTHIHADHVLGTDDLRCFNFATGKEIVAYADVDTYNLLRERFPYIFDIDPNYQGGMLARINFNILKWGEELSLLDVRVVPFRLRHGKMDVTGYRFGDYLTYATDCNFVPEESVCYMQNVDYLILDALRYKPHGTHFSIDEAVKLAQMLKPRKKTYLIHMTHDIDYDELLETLPDGIEPAYDGLTLQLED